MGRFETPDGIGGPSLPFSSSEQQTPMTPCAHMDMMQLIATLQQEVLGLRAQAHASRQTDSNVTTHTASPAASFAAYRPVGAPKLKDFKVIEITGEEQHSGLGADWDSFKYQFDVQIQTLETFDLVVWNEEHRLSTMAMCLRGAAFRHCEYLADRGLTANYDSVCRSMKNRFCCKLIQSQLEKLLEELKRNKATWTPYIEYMRAVARRMDGSPSKIILEYFCSYFCPSE
uniref:Uncharacterized protein n=1 Tax=Peronospora matthiolae TaxID=2874970 RepID=A0AAV1UTG2_9STRA